MRGPRVRLALAATLSTIPLLLISIYYFSFVKSDLENRILEKQNLMLENLSREIEFDFHQTFQQSKFPWRQVDLLPGTPDLAAHPIEF